MRNIKHIASVSFGKDSLAMLLRLIEEKWPLDEVVFYDTGMEFQAIYAIRDKIKVLLAEHKIKYTELHPQNPFLYDMFERPRKGGGKGWSWCGGPCRWGTGEKLKIIEKYCEDAEQYVGIAADEPDRLAEERRGNKRFPLAEWGMTENKCLTYCFDQGYDWVEDGGAGEVSLYYILDRVSCWCCCNKNLKELRNIYHYMPNYWDSLKSLQRRTERPMKGDGKSAFDLEIRFRFEDERLDAGLSITNKDFFCSLSKKLQTNEERVNGCAVR